MGHLQYQLHVLRETICLQVNMQPQVMRLGIPAACGDRYYPLFKLTGGKVNLFPENMSPRQSGDRSSPGVVRSYGNADTAAQMADRGISYSHINQQCFTTLGISGPPCSAGNRGKRLRG